ncbi:MAG: GreA/GreB family elongation factor [Planctomycetes bacterium]|nr:GreA/GreB family elongation factor [Planctomycetota bacterium]
MSLSLLVANEKWQDFDTAWKEMLESDGDITAVLEALALAGKKNRMSRCSAMLREHRMNLALAERHADAARLIGVGLRGGLSASEFGEQFFEHANKAWGEESWWEAYTESSGLTEGCADLRGAWTKFERLLAYQPESHVFHAGGWGTGKVLEVRAAAKEIVIRFANGLEDNFPMEGAVDIFQPLSDTDIRALYYEDQEGVVKRAKKEPLEILKLVLERHHGRAKLVSVKSALAMIGIESSSWSAWWRKCKKLVELSSEFRLSGGGTNPELRLLVDPTNPAEELTKSLKVMLSVDEVLGRANEVLTPKTGQDIKDVIQAAIKEQLESEEDLTELDKLRAQLFLRDLTDEHKEELASLMQSHMNVAEDEENIYDLFNELPGYKEQDQAVDALKEACGENWPEEVIENFQRLAPGMVRRLIDDLVEAGRGEDLAPHYTKLIKRPLRAPHVLTYLAKAGEKGDLGASIPKPMERANSLISLAAYLYGIRRENPDTTRSHGRIVDLLSGGDQPLLERLFEGASPKDLRTAQLTLQRGVDDSIDNLVATLVFRAGPVEEETSRFWEDGSIWTTRTGLDGRIQELKVLKDERVPQNEAALSAAAEQGDLSENAEWDAALEEQRNLASKIQQLESDISVAQLLENAMLPEATACPGTRVYYSQEGLDEEQSIAILGPWDQGDDDSVVSYQAPLAKGMLGMQAGESTTISLPGGDISVEVTRVETVKVD